ncbi:MAG: hypothetical protein ACRELZ_20290 [Candidatus Rokuibacteriota bacterium]
MSPMRAGCALTLGALVVVLGVGGVSLWVGFRLLQEPDVLATPGTPEDGVRGQQKLFALARGGTAWGRPRQVALTEAELNRFLSKNLVEAARMPVTFRAVRLAGDGVVEFKGLLALRDLLSASPLSDLPSAAWLERQVWLHLRARASLEVGTARGQRRYLRLDVQRFAIGRQPLPSVLLQLLPSPGLQGLLRWRMPESIEAITIDPGTVVIKTSS